MGDNLRIRTLRQQIINDLNESNLPFEVLRMILEDILREVNNLTETAIQKEIEELKEAANDKGNNTNDNIKDQES